MGDIVMTTDNEYFIKGSHKDHNIITYEKGLATPAKMTIPNITATVIKGFGTGVGGFSNTATILYSMAAIFDKPGHEDQYKEIMLRIKLLREIVGQEIDRIKGADKPSLPSEWKKFEKIEETDSPEEKTRKIKANALVISKKPYFFRYLYPELNQRFKQFESAYNQVAKDMFGMKFKKLMKKEEKTEEEKNLIRKYQKYCPLITSSCTMNNLCREFESIDFDIQFMKDSETDKKISTYSALPTFEEKYKDIEEKDKYLLVKKMYQQYNSKKQIVYLTSLFTDVESFAIDNQGNSKGFMNDYKELRSNIYDSIVEDLQQQLISNNLSGEEFLYYSHKLSKTYSSFNWSFVWEVLSDQIIKFIPSSQVLYPVLDPEGEYEYLGRRYSLKDITKIISTNTLDDADNLEVPADSDDIKPDEELFNKVLSKISPEMLQEGDDNFNE